ncbi:MAG: HAD family hydrolase, partial [Aestuariivirgaceae bacterium]|nr:HAD family hydrolase [Aestuariivirgaceae bacterium]
MLVIFDCDGVLVDSEILAAEAMGGLLAQHGLTVTVPQLLQFVGMKQADILAGVENIAGKPVPPMVVTDLWPQTRRLFSERLQPIAGVADFVANLAGPRCVASSSHHERIRFSLEKTGLHSLLAPHIFSASEVKNGKPAPDLFLHAAARMQAEPAHAIVIEDSTAGVTGARAAGMK